MRPGTVSIYCPQPLLQLKLLMFTITTNIKEMRPLCRQRVRPCPVEILCVHFIVDDAAHQRNKAHIRGCKSRAGTVRIRTDHRNHIARASSESFVKLTRRLWFFSAMVVVFVVRGFVIGALDGDVPDWASMGCDC